MSFIDWIEDESIDFHGKILIHHITGNICLVFFLNPYFKTVAFNSIYSPKALSFANNLRSIFPLGHSYIYLLVLFLFGNRTALLCRSSSLSHSIGEFQFEKSICFFILFYFISFDFILLHFTFLLDSIRPELVCLSTHRFAASNKTNGMIFLLCFARTRTRSHCIDLCKCKSMCVCFACTSICWLCVGPDLRYVCANLKPYLSIIFIRLPFAYTFSHI